MSPEVFRAQCRFLQGGRVKVVPLEDLVAATDAHDLVAITFDDGFANLDDHLPALAGLPATLFIVTEHVGGHNDWGGRRAPGIPHLPLLSWEQLGKWMRQGLRIGAHTRRHPHLPTMGDAELADELEGGLDRIRAELGVRPATFAYPFGAHDARVADAVRSRFREACTTELRFLQPGDDRATLPRLDMFYLRRPGQLEAWGSAAFRSRIRLRSLARRARASFAETWSS